MGKEPGTRENDPVQCLGKVVPRREPQLIMTESADHRPLDTQGRQVLRAFGQEGHVLVSSEQTGRAFCIMRFFTPPGADTPPHTHQNEDETFIIESGEVEVNVGGKLVRARTGDTVYLPKKIPHAPKKISDGTLQVVVVCVPGGFDEFFAACAEEWAKPHPEMSAIVQIAARFGIQFQAPA
jgi:quercetin dioxygenase-like cupin family protein